MYGEICMPAIGHKEKYIYQFRTLFGDTISRLGYE